MGYAFVHALDDSQRRRLHALYQREWWSAGRTEEQVRLVLEHSDHVLGIVMHEDATLVGFARVLTDRVFKAVIFDVIVDAEHRGRGLGRALIEPILQEPGLVRVKHIELYCRPEMTEFYQQFGFSADLPEIVYMRREVQSAP